MSWNRLRRKVVKLMVSGDVEQKDTLVSYLFAEPWKLEIDMFLALMTARFYC